MRCTLTEGAAARRTQKNATSTERFARPREHTSTVVQVRRTMKMNNAKRDVRSTSKVILRKCVCGGFDGEVTKRRNNELARPRRAHDSPAKRALDWDGDDEGDGDRDGDHQREEDFAKIRRRGHRLLRARTRTHKRRGKRVHAGGHYIITCWQRARRKQAVTRGSCAVQLAGRRDARSSRN